MKYLFDISNERIRELTLESKWIYLNGIEGRVLKVLSNNDYNTTKNICNFVYGYHDRCSEFTIYNALRNLTRKIKLEIKSKRPNSNHSGGFILNNEIYIM